MNLQHVKTVIAIGLLSILILCRGVICMTSIAAGSTAQAIPQRLYQGNKSTTALHGGRGADVCGTDTFTRDMPSFCPVPEDFKGISHSVELSAKPAGSTVAPADSPLQGGKKLTESITQLYSLDEYSRRASVDTTSPIVQGASFDPLFTIKAGTREYQAGFAYRTVEGKMVPEGLVVSYKEDGEDCRFTPLSWIYGNKYNGDTAFIKEKHKAGAVFPDYQTTLSYGLPTSISAKESVNEIAIRLEFQSPLEHIYSLKDQEAPQMLRGTDAIAASVEMIFSRESPRLVINTDREIKQEIINHNGFNFLQHVVYSKEPLSVSFGGQKVGPEADNRITALQLQEGKNGRIVTTTEYDKGLEIKGVVKGFDDCYILERDRKATVVYVPGFSRYACREQYTDAKGTRYPSNDLYAFMYNSYYNYVEKGFPSFIQPENPLVIKASVSEGHLGEGWVGIPLKPGVYKDTVVIQDIPGN